MDSQQKDALLDNYKFLIENILAEKLCPHLIENRVITMDDEGVIMSKPSKIQQVRELLQFVCRSSAPDTFQIFLNSLKENGWHFVEDELQKAFNKLKVASEDATDSAMSTSGETDDECQCIDTGSATSVNEIPQTVSYFCRRKRLEGKIHKCLEKHGYAVLAGIRGAGKTQLGRHLIHQMAAEASSCTLGNCGVKMEIYSRTTGNLHSGVEYLMQVLNVNSENHSNSMEKAVVSGLNTIMEHLKKLSAGCSGFHFLMFDDVTSETYSFLTNRVLKAFLKQSDKIKVLITTNNTNLYHADSIIVGGLDKQESLDLFKLDYESGNKDDDILELSEHLSYLPLGIAAAKQVVRKRHQTVQNYLKQLLSPSTSKKLQSKEAQVFVEKEYDKGLMAALTISIGEIASSLDPNLFKLYELTALGSHVRFPLCMLKMLMKWTKDDADKDFELGNLVEAITDTAIGTITQEEDEIYLDTHRAVLLALRLNWSSSQLREYIGSFLLLMSKVCVKDTRFQDAFRNQMTLLPHAETVMKHAVNYDHTTIGLQVAQVRLLEAIGYMYTQVSLLDKAQQYLVQARDFFAKYFLDNDATIFLADDNSLNMKKKAEVILAKLENGSVKQDSAAFLQFVLEQTHIEGDRDLWRTVLQQKFSFPNTNGLFTTPVLSKDEFLLLQKHKIALSESEIQKIFLPELLITTLFTLGRIYFFRSSKGELVSKTDGTTLKSSLQLAHDLCNLIHEKYNVPLVHLMLTRHYGLMYIMMEKKDKPQDEHIKMLLEAKANYENVLNDSTNYFQGGLLKKNANEDYNIAVCLRQLIRCHARLLRNDSHENWEYHKQSGMLYVQRLEEILKSNETLFHVSGFKLNIAKFYAQIALKEKTWKEFDMALQLYCQCCDVECKSGYVKYPWLLALKGLGYLLLHFGIKSREHYSISLVILKVKEFLHALHGLSTSFPFEWRKGCVLLTRMHSFEGSLSPGSYSCSEDFLKSPSRSFEFLEGTDEADCHFTNLLHTG